MQFVFNFVYLNMILLNFSFCVSSVLTSLPLVLIFEYFTIGSFLSCYLTLCDLTLSKLSLYAVVVYLLMGCFVRISSPLLFRDLLSICFAFCEGVCCYVLDKVQCVQTRLIRLPDITEALEGNKSF